MTNQERLVRAESIRRRRSSGKITAEQAAEEFDALLMVDGELVYNSDSTGLTADWDEDVMLFPQAGYDEHHRIPSNTGIFARGPRRGWLITRPAGAEPNCSPEALDHFCKTSKGWDGGPSKRPPDRFGTGPQLPAHYAAPGPPIGPHFNGEVTFPSGCAMAGCQRPACSCSNSKHYRFCCQPCYETDGRSHDPGCDEYQKTVERLRVTNENRLFCRRCFIAVDEAYRKRQPCISTDGRHTWDYRPETAIG